MSAMKHLEWSAWIFWHPSTNHQKMSPIQPTHLMLAYWARPVAATCEVSPFRLMTDTIAAASSGNTLSVTPSVANTTTSPLCKAKVKLYSNKGVSGILSMCLHSMNDGNKANALDNTDEVVEDISLPSHGVSERNFEARGSPSSSENRVRELWVIKANSADAWGSQIGFTFYIVEAPCLSKYWPAILHTSFKISMLSSANRWAVGELSLMSGQNSTVVHDVPLFHFLDQLENKI